MMRDDELFLSELELYPLVKIQRAALGLSAALVASSSTHKADMADAKRSAMPPSSTTVTPTANRLSVNSPIAQDYARKQAMSAPVVSTSGVPVFKKPQALPETLLDAERAAKIATLDWLTLQNQVSACTDCGLCGQRKQAVFGLGAVAPENNIATPATWMFIGDAPSVDDDSFGEPFLGEAGKLVDAILQAAHLKRGEDVFMTNIIKCRPPGNRTPTALEIAACTPYLMRQITLVQPKIIVAFGKIAMQALTGSELPITQLRGSVHYVAGIPIIATFNPAYLLRNMPEKAKVWDDLLMAKVTLASLA